MSRNTVVVEDMADISAEESDLEEFMHDAADVVIGFLGFPIMQCHICGTAKRSADYEKTVWGGGAGCR